MDPPSGMLNWIYCCSRLAKHKSTNKHLLTVRSVGGHVILIHPRGLYHQW